MEITLESTLGDLLIHENRLHKIPVCLQYQKLYWNNLICLSTLLLGEELKRLRNQWNIPNYHFKEKYSSHSSRNWVNLVSQDYHSILFHTIMYVMCVFEPFLISGEEELTIISFNSVIRFFNFLFLTSLLQKHLLGGYTLLNPFKLILAETKVLG